MAHRRRRRCGPWCCRSVSSLGFALLTEDNLPRSACRASAGVSGCVRDASYACKTSLLTRGTPRPSAHRASARSGLQPAPHLQCAPALAYNSRWPLETKAPPAHRASLVCGLVNAPGCGLARTAICREGLTSSQCRRAWASAPPPSGRSSRCGASPPCPRRRGTRTPRRACGRPARSARRR